MKRPAYALQFLDDLVYYTYNPDSRDYSENISDYDAANVISNIKKDESVILGNIITQIFDSGSPFYLIQHYFRALQLLSEQLSSYRVNEQSTPGPIRSVYAQIEQTLHFLLEEMGQRFGVHLEEYLEKAKSKRPLLVNLSADQVGMLLRAAGDLKILEAKSMSAIFRTIIPHISTPHSKALSWEATRGKAYQIEERDKTVVLEMLNKMIEAIKDY